jgi:tetratricopeptide (TPR) repeat protein
MRRALVSLVCLASSALSPPGPARAQELDLSALQEALPGFDGEPDELSAFFALVSQRLIHARELATKVLRKNPRSYIAHYVMGEVEHDAEANFPRAVYHLEQARSLFEARHGAKPGEQAPWRWHSRIMLSLAFAYGEIERHDKKLGLLARYNELYDPDRLADRAWPLMKLRKFAEARKAAEQGINTGDARQREVALNSLCAIEFEAGNDAKSYEACKAAMDNARSMGSDLDPADLMNFAEASRSVFKLDEAERIDREAADAAVAWYGNPWSELAELYLREGRLSETLAALRNIPRYRAERPPHVRESDRNENRRALSAFFVILGRPDDALRVTQKAMVAPDRRGHNSRDKAQDLSVAALLDSAAHRLKAERAREHAASLGVYARSKAALSALSERFQAWTSARKAVRAVADATRLSGSFQIGTARAAVMPPWLAGELVQALGPGASRAALQQARKQDRRSQASAYYDAFEGEAAYEGGDDEEAEKLLSRALGNLPEAEQLLRARTLALLSSLRLARGARDLAYRDFERTLQIDPSVLRRLALALPVRVQAAGDDTSEAFVSALERSPRFDVGEGGLLVRVKADRARGEACLLGVSGAELACARAEAKANEDADALAGKLLDAFHERAFAPQIDLSQVDANSLDGSNLRGTGEDLSPLLEGEGME